LFVPAGFGNLLVASKKQEQEQQAVAGKALFLLIAPAPAYFLP